MDQRLRRRPGTQTQTQALTLTLTLTRQMIGCAAVAMVLGAACRTASPVTSPMTMTWAAYAAFQRSGRHPEWPPQEIERVLRVFAATPGLSGNPRTIDELESNPR
jgi:hypothetical protein